MARHPRIDIGGVVYHVLNRANARVAFFEADADCAYFEGLLAEGKTRHPIDLFSYELMPNHWHSVVRPRADGILAKFFGWVEQKHAQYWHAKHGTTGAGHLYQGRYKSFPVETDSHFLALCRYVEQNALRAGLVQRAQDWRWSSLWQRLHGGALARRLLDPWPVPEPTDYLEWVNAAPSRAELDRIREASGRGRPFGSDAWMEQTMLALGIHPQPRQRGRPRKGEPWP